MSLKNDTHDERKKIFEKLNNLSGSGDMPCRIELCRLALDLTSRIDEPKLWGKLQDDLGNSLIENPRGSRAEQVEQAIHHFRLALEVRTIKEIPDEWATTNHNLAGAYLWRIKGNRANNIEKAIYHYGEALKVRNSNRDSMRWAMTQFNLANAFYKRIHGERAQNLEKAILHSHQALRVFTRRNFPHYWAQTKNTLGEVYRVRVCGPRLKNIERAIYHLNQALEVNNPAQFPEDWSVVQNNLAIAFLERLRGVRAENIEQAIQHFNFALEVRTRDEFPERWAITQHNLGNAYRHRIQGDPAENIEQAIHHYQRALEVRTFEAFPESWAETQNSLGNALLGRIRGEHDDNIKEAIEHLRQAKKVYTFNAFPEPWAQVHHNLGNAHMALSSVSTTKRSDRTRAIEQAIVHFESALSVRTRTAFPKDWAETHNNLAGAYTLLSRSKPGLDIEPAIDHLQQALKVYTREAFPQDWAGTMHNLASAYADRIQGKRVDNIEQAIDYYQQALAVYIEQSLLDNRLKTARALGNLAFKEQRWELARDTYEVAFQGLDLLMQASFSRAGKQIELSQIQNLSARAAYAHLQLKQDEDTLRRAVEVMEQGRAQLLRESLERQRQDLDQLREMGFEDLHQEYVQSIKSYNSLQQEYAPESTRSGEWISQIEQALARVQAATAQIREKVGKHHPQYRYFLKSLPFEAIQKQAREKPLVYLSATPEAGLALVVSGQEVYHLILPNLDQDSLREQIWKPSDEEVDRINAHIQKGKITLEDIQAVRGGYFSTYALWSLTSHLTNTKGELKRELFEVWKKTLEDTFRWLWDAVMGKLVTVLKKHAQSIVLIPSGYLAILPLHAAWTGDLSDLKNRQYVLDELNISYAPSAHALWQASSAAERPSERLLVIDNPDGSLRFTKREVEDILSNFDKSNTKHLRGNDAISETVKTGMQNAEVLHFATHGSAGWQDEAQARLMLADGNLTLPDIFELDLQQARLAVLSACETGIPGLKLIDEMIGLPAGMMQAGVPGVIGSLWMVNDRSTARLMGRFYTLWREKGLKPQEALRQAQIFVRDTQYRSPYYWAAFTYTGV